MKTFWTAVAFVVVTLYGGVCRAQDEEPATQEIRSKIKQLQTELDATQAKSDQRRGVTRIGGSTRPVESEELLVRVYDLHDLFAMAPAYPAFIAPDFGPGVQPLFHFAPGGTRFSGGGGFGGGGGGGGGFFNIPAATGALTDAARQLPKQNGRTERPQTSIEDLIEAITSSISPTDWTDVGGTFTIIDLGTVLIVSADEEAHEQIDRLLELLRERWKTLRTVSIRADWLWLTSAEVGGIVLPADKRTTEQPYGVVDGDKWAIALAATPAAESRPLHAATTCYNAQTISLVSGAESAYVSQIEPTAAGDSEEGQSTELGYTPTTRVLFEGAALQVTPLINKRGTIVTLDIQSRLSRRQAESNSAPTTPAGSARDAAAAIDLPRLAIAQLATTIRAPVETTMLVGGMDLAGEPAAGDRGLYLFVSVSVQELRDDDQASPAASEPASTK